MHLSHCDWISGKHGRLDILYKYEQQRTVEAQVNTKHHLSCFPFVTILIVPIPPSASSTNSEQLFPFRIALTSVDDTKHHLSCFPFVTIPLKLDIHNHPIVPIPSFRVNTKLFNSDGIWSWDKSVQNLFKAQNRSRGETSLLARSKQVAPKRPTVCNKACMIMVLSHLSWPDNREATSRKGASTEAINSSELRHLTHGAISPALPKNPSTLTPPLRPSWLVHDGGLRQRPSGLRWALPSLVTTNPWGPGLFAYYSLCLNEIRKDLLHSTYRKFTYHGNGNGKVSTTTRSTRSNFPIYPEPHLLFFAVHNFTARWSSNYLFFTLLSTYLLT